MNIRPRAEELKDLAIQSFLQLRPVSQPLKVATGMLVPATDRRGLGTAKESPRFVRHIRPQRPQGQGSRLARR
jgi:hypothetical protein